MLDILEQEIDQQHDYPLKSGVLLPPKDRQEMTNAFNAGGFNAFSFLWRAGGVGLNLTGADTVIFSRFGGILRWKIKLIGHCPIEWDQNKMLKFTAWLLVVRLKKIQEHSFKKTLEYNDFRWDGNTSSLSVEEIREILGVVKNNLKILWIVYLN